MMNYIQGFSETILTNIKTNVINNSELDYFRSMDFDFNDYYWFIFYNDQEIIGIIKTQKSIFYETDYPFWGISYVSVNKKYKNQKIASKLLENCFKHFKDYFLIGTEFSEEGIALLQKARNLAMNHNVYYIDEPIKKEIMNSLNNRYPSKQELYQSFYKK